MLALLPLGSAHADLILSPVSVVSNSLGDRTDEPVASVIDQSGLSGGFTSGVTDYATYLSTSPTHVARVDNGGQWRSTSGNTTGSIVFDLGQPYTIERFAIWQGGSNARARVSRQNINGVTLETSPDPAFTSPFAAGSFNVPRDVGVSAWPVNDFDLADSTARYVRLTINSNYDFDGTTSSTRFGEIAFEVSAIPEPSAALSGGLLMVGLLSKRRQRAST
ncbi:MAG: discoidin domain-containing protein [Planctomycetota bacterium]